MLKILENHIDTVLTVCVTILGFIISYIMTSRNLKDEIKKDKISLATQTIYTLPYDICQLMDDIIKNKNKNPQDFVEKYGMMLSKVLSYGSKEAIKIAVKMQQLSYDAEGKTTEERLPLLAAYALLITQLKYDLTSEIISPECWFEMRMKDYSTIKTSMKNALNSLIDELKLNHDFTVQ